MFVIPPHEICFFRVEKCDIAVDEAITDDVAKGIVRIDTNFMREIDVRPGDIVEIEGQRKTVALVDRAFPGDIGVDLIRMDPLSRKNAKSSIGDVVYIRKADVKEAKRVVIAPSREGIVVKATNTAGFKQGLLGRAIVKGDLIGLGGTRRRRMTMTGSPLIDEVFSMGLIDEAGMIGFGFGDLKFVIVETNPKQAVIITSATDLVLNPEAVEVKEDSLLEVAYEDIGGLEDEIKKSTRNDRIAIKTSRNIRTVRHRPAKRPSFARPARNWKDITGKSCSE